MKFCPKCNSQYDDCVGFCTQDGSPLKSNTVSGKMKSPGMTLSPEGGSALGSSALSLSQQAERNPSYGLVCRWESTPRHDLQPTVEDDFVPGDEVDPYADSPSFTFAVPSFTVSTSLHSPTRPNQPASAAGPRLNRPPLDPYVGKEILAGQLKVLERIGVGGVGAVYKAYEPSMDRLVAVKILHAKFNSRKDLASRFRREARAMSHLTHPNTVRVHGFGQLEDNTCCLIMEYLEGRSLGQFVRQEGPMPASRAIAVLVQACEALEEAHQLGIIHRDVKPGNIFLCEQCGIDDFVKVLDFGIAKVTEREKGPGSHFVTAEDDVFGTPEFMSPEQARGTVLDRRSDIYSLGVTLYELVTGRLLFEASSPMEFVAAHIWEAPLPPSEWVPVPAGFDAVLFKALAKRPDERFATACEFASALAVLVKAPDRTAANARGVAARHEEAPTMVSAPPLTALGEARIGEIHPTNLRAHEGLRASARMAADSEGDPNVRAAEAKRRASALEAIHAIEHTLYQRLERARTDRVMATCLRGSLPSINSKRMTFPQRRLSEMLDGGGRPSLDLLAQLVTATEGAPALTELVRAILGVPEELTAELRGVGALRNVLAHQSEYEIDEEAALRGADGWIERVSSSDTTEIRVLPETLDRLAWVAACLLERRVRPREEFGR